MQPSVRSTKFNEAIRVALLRGETRRVRGYEPSRTGVWQRGVVPPLVIAAFLLMTAAVVVGLEEYKSKCFAISRAGALCH